MKTFTYFCLLISLVIISLPTQRIYSQTTYDYFEKQRLERKEKKVKTISTYDYFNDALSRKDYFDENGYLIKSECYYTNLDADNIYVSQEIVVNKYNDNSSINGIGYEFESAGSKINEYAIENMKLEYFFEIVFEETVIDNVNYIFDNKGNLIEKRFYSEDYNSGEYDKEILIYDSHNLLIESKYYTTGSSTVSINKYYYNSDGLLEKEESSYDFTNEKRVYGIRYEYEFYN